MTDQPKRQKVLKPQPYYQNYSANWNSNRQFKLMSLEERGLLWTLYNEYWINDFLPSNSLEMARYFAYNEQVIKVALTDRVLSFFHKVGDELRCPELDGYRQNVSITREAQSEGGKKGAAIKKHKAQGRPKGDLEGKPEGSLYQINSNQINSSQFIKKEEFTEDVKAWLEDYEEAPDAPSEYLKQSRGG